MNAQNLSTDLPDYLDRGGEQCLLQPFQTQDTEAYGFYLLAEQERLQSLCDQYLNEPSSGAVDYVPLLPLVLVLFNDYPRLASIPQQEQGFITYKEVVFSVPVVNRNDAKLQDADFLDITELLSSAALFIPFIFADNSIAIASGREIYGYPKQWGWIEMPTGPDLNQPLSLEAVAWPTYGIDNPATRQRIATITNRTQKNERLKIAQPAGLKTEHESIKAQLVKHIAAQYRDSQSDLSLPEWEKHVDGILRHLTSLLNISFENVFLKEFRDAVDGTKACYQAVLQAPYEQIKVSELQFYFDLFSVDIPLLESMPLKEQLGLRPVSSLLPNQFISLVAYHTVFDFQVANGTILWQAG